MRDLFSHGSVPISTVSQMQVRLHWTLPVGLVLFGGLSWPRTGAVLVVLVVHSLAQVWAVRSMGARVLRLTLTGLGSHCTWRTTVGASGLGFIAWSGVVAQGILLLLWAAWRVATGFAAPAWLLSVDEGLLVVNAALIALNLLPVPGLEGELAWSSLRTERRAPPHARPRPAVAPDPEQEARRAETERIFRKMLDQMLPPSRVDKPRDED